jgi:hypothetical protein
MKRWVFLRLSDWNMEQAKPKVKFKKCMLSFLAGILIFCGLSPGAHAQVSPVSGQSTAPATQSPKNLLRASYQVGLNISTLGGGDAQFSTFGSEGEQSHYWRGQAGARATVLVDFSLGSPQWVIETGVDYLSAGAYTGQISYPMKVEDGEPRKTAHMNTKLNLQYVGLPIFFKYYPRSFSQSGVFVKGGLEPVMLVNSTFDVPFPEDVSAFQSNDSPSPLGDSPKDFNFQQFDVLTTVGAGLNIQIHPKWSIVLEGVVQQGIVSVDPAHGSSVFNQAFSLNFGFSMLL